jgi:hypothetical protein
MVAASAVSGGEVVSLLCESFPRCVNWKNKLELDALMIAAKTGNDDAVSVLISYGADVAAQDIEGNTALHFASAYGHLKALQTLLANSASPHARNHFSWTPISYSLSVQAEVYFKALVQENEKHLPPNPSFSASELQQQQQQQVVHTPGSTQSYSSYFPSPGSTHTNTSVPTTTSYRRPTAPSISTSTSSIRLIHSNSPIATSATTEYYTNPGPAPPPPFLHIRPSSSASNAVSSSFSTTSTYYDPPSAPPPPPPTQPARAPKLPSSFSTLNLAQTRMGGASALFLAAAVQSDAAERAASAAEFRNPPPPIFPDRIERAPTPTGSNPSSVAPPPSVIGERERSGSGGSSAFSGVSSGLGGVRAFVQRGRARSGS